MSSHWRLLASVERRFRAQLEAWLPLLFILAAVVLGIAYALIMPPLQVPDEVAHWTRAYGVSTGECIAPKTELIPDSMRALMGAFPPQMEQQRRLIAGEVNRWGKLPLDPRKATAQPNVAAAIYSCVPYIPAGAATAIGRRFAASPLTLLRIGRLANLSCYVSITFIAIRLLIGFRLTLFVLALMPMALHQAASLSADSLTISSSFLFYAYVMHLAFGTHTEKLNRKHAAILLGMGVFASCCKFNVWMLLFSALIPAVRCGGRFRLVILVTATVAAGSLTAGVWQALNQDNLQRFKVSREQVDVYPARNAQFLEEHPGIFAETMERTIIARKRFYLMSFVGWFGWFTAALPWWLCVAYGVWLILISATPPKITIPGKAHGISLVVVIGAFTSTFALLWVLDLPATYLAQAIVSLHQGHVPGIQGRYFIPIAFPFLVFLSRSHFRLPSSLAIILSLAIICFANITGYRTISSAYYIPSNRSDLAKAGVFREGHWIIDSNNNGEMDDSGDRYFSLNQVPGAIPVVGDWNGDGRAKAGLYRDGMWHLDFNGNNLLEPVQAGDRIYHFGGLPGDIPVVGDWNGDGRDKVGVFRQGFLWILDQNGDGVFTEGADPVFPFGGLPDDKPVVGRWNGANISKVGIYRKGEWLLDVNGERKLNPAHPVYHFGGAPEDVPVPGDWAGGGRSRLAIYRNGVWIIRLEDESRPNRILSFGGLVGDRPVAGNW